jgi:hypothetical protein
VLPPAVTVTSTIPADAAEAFTVICMPAVLTVNPVVTAAEPKLTAMVRVNRAPMIVTCRRCAIPCLASPA